jgi:Leucine-rich repeat (LRR) protein
MPNLKRLGVMYNKLKHIDLFENLIELECDHNEIRKIDGLPKLTTLYVNNNKLEELGELPNLRTLEIKKNIISKIPYYKTLEFLIGDHKKIQQLSSKYVISAIDVFKDDVVTIVFKNT